MGEAVKKKKSACKVGDLGSISSLGRSLSEGNSYALSYSWVFFGGTEVKNLPAIWKTWDQSLGQEDSPGEGNGYPLQYSSWRIPWTEETGRQQSMGSEKVGRRQSNWHFFNICIIKGLMIHHLWTLYTLIFTT